MERASAQAMAPLSDSTQFNRCREAEGEASSCERPISDMTNSKESPCGTLFFPGSLPSTPEVGLWTEKVASRARLERLPARRARVRGRESVTHLASSSASVPCPSHGTKRPLEDLSEASEPSSPDSDFAFDPRGGGARASVGAPGGADLASPTWLALDLSSLSIARPAVLARTKKMAAPVVSPPSDSPRSNSQGDAATVPIWKRRCLSRPRALIVGKPILA